MGPDGMRASAHDPIQAGGIGSFKGQGQKRAGRSLCPLFPLPAFLIHLLRCRWTSASRVRNRRLSHMR